MTDDGKDYPTRTTFWREDGNGFRERLTVDGLLKEYESMAKRHQKELEEILELIAKVSQAERADEEGFE